MTKHDFSDWWQRPDLCYQQQQLYFSGHRVADFARQMGSPTFVYSARRVRDNIERVKQALAVVAGQRNHRLYYAMKANRFAPLLTYLKQTGLCGIDACSPAEVEHAIGCGFMPGDISFTATSLAGKDFDILARYDDLLFNADSLYAIREWGKRRPGSEIGIRINPAVGVSRASNQLLQYAGPVTTKFGIYKEQFSEALAVAESYGLVVRRIHFHTGCGYLTDQLSQWRAVLKTCLRFVDQVPTVQRVNIGGGLGVPHVESDEPLNLESWASIIKEFFTTRDLAVDVEPGDYLVKDAGLLLLGITYIEEKESTRILGVDAGFNIAPEPAYYKLPFQPVPLSDSKTVARTPYHVVGNINEALDIWSENVLLPDMTDEHYLALINAGAYSSSMASNHCMRGQFKECLLLS
ncbi:diaminopimelate decarboxylase [Desulforhopalus sp. IMCC35007]|uniref:diaminopimelate decarboxylase n=1 Tax=Desulforhopalus sp. IMCC35007 TaxID=2569543 RepID=UPI0010AE9626|nr:diaminopimelate decarboxylase [Desulforhopalus sp. IMCC35007]TKB10678.1 diaminopimelate decarboxylase [Desulforhopalus sp. IMCC35007]